MISQPDRGNAAKYLFRKANEIEKGVHTGATSNVEHVVSPHKLICMAPQTIGDGAHTKTNTYMCDPTGDVCAPHEAVLSAYRRRFI